MHARFYTGSAHGGDEGRHIKYMIKQLIYYIPQGCQPFWVQGPLRF